MGNRSGVRSIIHALMIQGLILGLGFPAYSGPEDFKSYGDNKMEVEGMKTQAIKDALKDCVEKEGSSANACNEDTSPFAQAAIGALSALMPLLMQNQGTKQDCNKVDAAQAQASQQMGQGMPGCGGGGGQPQQGQQGQQGQQPQQQNGGNNMAKDCGSKAGEGKKTCSEAKKKISGIKESKKCKEDPSCQQDAQKGEEIASKSEKSNEKMGSMNIGQIMQMLGQMLCQMQKAQQCQKDVCSAPGQLKFDTADPKMTSAVPGQTKVLQDDEGCMVDCNNMNYVSDPQYPQWAAKVNARITKFKPQCECLKTPSLPGCGSITSPTAAALGEKKKGKAAAALSDESGKGNANDKTLGAQDSSSKGGGGGVGAMGGGSGISGGKGGSDPKKDPARPGAPPGPPQVSNGFEGGGGSPSKSGGGASDDPIGKYSKFLPGRKPQATPDAGLQITGAGGKSIWEKVSDAYRIKASSLSR